jgi:hypothetical protein
MKKTKTKAKGPDLAGTDLKAEDLTADRLLALATEFDAGPEPIVNGQLYDPRWSDADLHRVTIQWRGAGWSINKIGRSVLNRDGEWEFEMMPSSRTDDDLQRTRWPTALAAFRFFIKWRNRVVKEFIKEHPNWKEEADAR